jgi:hypothetical protein
VSNVVQLMIFPGWKSPPPAEGEEKPRLDVVVSIKIKDNKTGEVFKRDVHQDYFDGSEVMDGIEGIVQHRRIQAEVNAFCDRRVGWPESTTESSYGEGRAGDRETPKKSGTKDEEI